MRQKADLLSDRAVKHLEIKNMNQEDKIIQFKNNPYQYTRGIRFRVNPQRESKQFKEKYNFNSQKLDNIGLSDLKEKLLEFHKKLKSLISYSKGKNLLPQAKSSNNPARSTESNKNNVLQFSAKLSINKTWLKHWYKDLFYNKIKKDKQGKYVLKDLAEEIHSDFQERLESWKKYTEQIKKSVSRSKHSQVRHSDLSEYIKALLNRKQWGYWKEFLTETKTTDQDDKLKDLENNLEDIGKQLKSAERDYLSSQSEGIEIAKASFNYYTVNKKPKKYYQDELQKAKEQLNECAFSIIKKDKNSAGVKWIFCNKKVDREKNQRDTIFTFKSEQEKKWIERYIEINKNSNKFTGNLEEGVSFSIDQSYQLMKAFKADQKSIFYELMTHIASNQNKSYTVNIENSPLKDYEFSYKELNFENINKMFSLFEFKDKKFKNKGKKDFKPKYTLDKILYQYKNTENKVTADKAYQAFIDLTKNIQSSKQSSKNYKKQRIQHPKHRFLASRNNRFRNIEDREDTSIKNKDVLGEGKKAKQNRGAFLFGKFCYFKEYESFCEKYKNIAKDRGRLIAQIKGIEREKQESAQTDFWSLIYCEKNKKQLWLIPKSVSKENDLKDNQKANLQKAKEKINTLKESSLKQETKYLSYIESLTKRALHKLCFAEQSSFVRDMPEYLKQLQNKAKTIKTTEGDEAKQKERLKEKKQLEFFKELLKSDYAKEKLDLKNFDLSQIDKAPDMLSFEKALEEECYHVKKLIFKNDEEKESFINEFNVTVLDISSYDLEGRNKNTFQTPESANRLHTELWETFWNSVEKPCGHQTIKVVGSKEKSACVEKLGEHQKIKGFKLGKVRLNPEVKIRYREANEDLKRYFKTRNFPDSFKNRRLQNQWTAHFTLALNAGNKYEDLAFAKTEDLADKINKFNEELNNKMQFKTAWKYGIDRGQKELATLCLVKFNPDKEVYTIGDEEKEIVKPIFPTDGEKMECYTLTDYRYSKTLKGETKKRYAVKNPSYFINEGSINNDLFKEEESISCLDLTIAKVIKGKIITNGDVLTYLKLKKESAKRQLFELYHSRKINEDSTLEWSEWQDGQENNKEKERPEGVLNITLSSSDQENKEGKEKEGNEKKKQETIYYYDKRFADIPIKEDIKYNKDSIRKSLNFYLQELKNNDESHTPSISKINHLRDAITANMVGVICHLQKEYPGFVILEDLKKSTIDKHFFDNNENISRRFENALYNKFQTLGLVPPHVKDIIQLREKSREFNKTSTKSSQVGAIAFVDKDKTSKTCPYCETIAEKNNDLKCRQHRFICNNDKCGFDTYFFKPESEQVEKPEPPPVNKELNKEEFKILEDINDPDKVAAYNIAKKITDPEKIGKMKLK